MFKIYRWSRRWLLVGWPALSAHQRMGQNMSTGVDPQWSLAFSRGMTKINNCTDNIIHGRRRVLWDEGGECLRFELRDAGSTH